MRFIEGRVATDAFLSRPGDMLERRLRDFPPSMVMSVIEHCEGDFNNDLEGFSRNFYLLSFRSMSRRCLSSSSNLDFAKLEDMFLILVTKCIFSNSMRCFSCSRTTLLSEPPWSYAFLLLVKFMIYMPPNSSLIPVRQLIIAILDTR